MKSKKIIALLLSAAMMSGTFVTVNASEGNAEEEKTYTLNLTVPVNGAVDEDNETEEYLSSLVPGLKVEVTAIEIGSYFDILNPRLASGEIPDVFHVHNNDMYNSYLEQGILGGVDPQLIKEYMPKFLEASNEFSDGIWSLVQKDGLIYGMPTLNVSNTRAFTNSWRGDWLEAVGIEKVPETIDEYEEALTRFTFNDPDGNGVDDTYGTTMRGKDSIAWAFSSLYGAYGLYPGTWNMADDGKVYWGVTHPNGKAALEKINSWYEKGIIDPEIATVDGTIRSEKWQNGKVGLLSDGTYYEVKPGSANCDSLLALNPEAEIVRGPAPKGDADTWGYVNWGHYTNRVVFGKSLLEDEGKLEKVLQFYEILNTDPEVATRAWYGVEGTHWERDENNAIVRLAPYNDPLNCGASGTYIFQQGGGIALTPEVQKYQEADNEAEMYQYAVQGTMKNGEQYSTALEKFVAPEVGTAYNAEAAIVYQKNLIDFITGARSLDEYDAFLEEWRAAGGADYEAAYNQANTELEALKAEVAELFK